jgi:hypothetical protein
MTAYQCDVYEMPLRHAFGAAVRCSRSATEPFARFRVCHAHRALGDHFVRHRGRLFLVSPALEKPAPPADGGSGCQGRDFRRPRGETDEVSVGNEGTAEYHYVCQQHGLVALPPCYEEATRQSVLCPNCGQLAELWLGSGAQRGEMMLSGRAKRVGAR